MANLIQRVVVEPVKRLLRMGATPERLAWSLAVGVVVGVNPLIGTTTLLVLGLAALFRLNMVASQVGNHAMYPVEIAMFPVFIKLGSLVFSTERMPIEGSNLLAAAKQHPWDTTRMLWLWEWHALVVWAVFAAVLLPALGFGLRPVLEHMLTRMRRQSVAATS
jgi:uncharacterized protein (DUF2062 family)